MNLRESMGAMGADTGAHVCLRAPDEAAVRAFHAAALSLGGTDGGTPGLRQATMTAYFGAFIHDPDGNKVEAGTFPKYIPAAARGPSSRRPCPCCTPP